MLRRTSGVGGFIGAAVIVFVSLVITGLSGVVMPRLAIERHDGSVVVDGVEHHRASVRNDAPTSVHIEEIRLIVDGSRCGIEVSMPAPDGRAGLVRFASTRLEAGGELEIHWEAKHSSRYGLEIIASGRSGLARTVESLVGGSTPSSCPTADGVAAAPNRARIPVSPLARPFTRPVRP